MRLQWTMQSLSVISVLTVSLITIVRCQIQDGCPKSYTPLTEEICVSVSLQGTWLSATNSCPYRSVDTHYDFIEIYRNSDTKIIGNILENINKLDSKVKEVWWLDKNSILNHFCNESAKISKISSLHEVSNSFSTFSRWKWLNTSESSCVSLDLTTNMFHDRGCSSEESELQFPAICLSARSAPELTCPEGFSKTWGLNSSCGSILFDSNYTWSETVEVCSEKGYGGHMLLHGYKNVIKDSEYTCGDLLPLSIEKMDGGTFWINENGINTQVTDEKLVETSDENCTFGALNLTTGQIIFVEDHYEFSCALCETNPVLIYRNPSSSQLHRSGDINVGVKSTIALRHNTTYQQANISHLTLTITNYDSKEHIIIQCFTDASTSKFASPQYNKIDFNTTDPFNVISTESTNNDMFFLRVKEGKRDLECCEDNGNINKPAIEKITNIKQFPNGSKSLDIAIRAYNSGYYWCKGSNKFTNQAMYTDQVLVDIPNDGSYLRYSLLLETQLLRSKITTEIAFQFTMSLATVLKVSDGILELKSITNNDTYLRFHVTLPLDHGPIADVLGIDVKNSFRVISLQNTDTCVSKNVTDFREQVHVLPDTRRGATYTLHENECPSVVFECKGDFIDGAIWYEPETDVNNSIAEWGERCSTQITSSNENIEIASISPIEAAAEIANLTKEPVYSDRLPVVGDLMNTILTGSDFTAASSNVLLDLETILSNMIILDSNLTDVVQDIKSHVALLVANVLTLEDPVVGVDFRERNGEDILTAIRSSESDIQTSKDSQVFFVIKQSIISRNRRLAFAVFSKTNAFREKFPNITINSPVINIVLTQDGSAVKFPEGEFIDIYFRPNRSTLLTNETKTCVFWDEEEQNWSEIGCVLDRTTAEGMDVCRCNHLTHFAQIITGARPRHKISQGHETALEVISITGCTLSLLGLLVIVVTAIVFKSWRLELGNKILLNLSAALTLNLITFLLVYGGVGGSEGAGCISVGAVLHYSVLACFCWMLIMSGLQVLRLLTILGNKGISNLLLKASIVGWGVPLIPVIILLAWDPKFYSSTSVESVERTFCYPSGSAFYATIAAPVGFIVVVNIMIYLAILCRLCACFGWGNINGDLQRHGISDGIIAMRRLRTLVFLFFLFGLTWTFGFFVRYLLFTYLFCIFAPLQGFVIFTFFFLIEKKSVGHWKSAVSKSSGKESYTSSGTKNAELFETIPLRFPQEEDSSVETPNTDATAAIRPRANQGKEAPNKINIKSVSNTDSVVPDDITGSDTYKSFGSPDYLDEGQNKRYSASESRQRNVFKTFQ